jgi:hypothetical protein
MSFGIFQRAIDRPKPVRRAAGAACTLIETLEPRRLLSGHCSVTPKAAPAPISTVARAAISEATAVFQAEIWINQHQARAGVASANEGDADIPTTPGSPMAAAITMGGADVTGSAPVERLGSGLEFSGYQYINPDGSAPPPLVHVVEVGGNGLLEVVSGGGTVVSPVSSDPKKIKPSNIELPGVASGPAVTPLAQTPVRSNSNTISNSNTMSSSAGRIAVPTPAPVGVAPAVSISPAPAREPIYLGAVGVEQPVGVAFVGATAVAGKVADGLAYASNKAGDALSLLSSGDSMDSAATYNFVHFNPSFLLNDAMAAFSQESASLSFVPMPTHSTVRAWSITAAVIGLDLLLIGYCYQRGRRQKTVASALIPTQRAGFSKVRSSH